MSAAEVHIFLLQILLFLEGNVMHGICQNASLFYGTKPQIRHYLPAERLIVANLRKVLKCHL